MLHYHKATLDKDKPLLLDSQIMTIQIFCLFRKKYFEASNEMKFLSQRLEHLNSNSNSAIKISNFLRNFYQNLN